MLERNVLKQLKKRVKEAGGELRKVKWIGRSHAPDDLVLLWGTHFLVEGKATGKEPRAGQIREHQRLRDSGFIVYVVSSVAEIDDIFNWRKQ